VLLIVGFVLFASYRLTPPSFEHSFPRVLIHNGICIVEFDATNHTSKPVTKALSISFGVLPRGIKFSGPNFTRLERREVSVSLVPSEMKHIRCEFSHPGYSANYGAEITILQ